MTPPGTKALAEVTAADFDMMLAVNLRRYASSGVTVNGLAPALITETGMLPGDPEDLRRQIPAGRLGRPDEVADLALASLRSAYPTNQVISLDGRMYPR